MIPFQLVIVLVVEDDETQQLIMLTHLERIGVKYYYIASSGEEALAKLRADLFHVVITDNQMPVMNGCQLVTEIRKDPLLRHLRVAMLSIDLDHSSQGADANLREFLWQNNVLAVPKENLDTATVARTIQTLVEL